MSRIAGRMAGIAPFHVMALLGQARRLEAQGRDVVHMEIGEPDFPTPEPIIEAGRAALAKSLTHYTPAAGLPALREAIAGYYADRFGVAIEPERVLVTPGASGALQLVLGVLVDHGDRVAITDPGYPCNRHMIIQYGGEPVAIPVSAANGYRVGPEQLVASMAAPLRALIVASPANPTGNLIAPEELRGLLGVLSRQPDAVLICDEIYQGLQYGTPVSTALSLGADNVVVVNSFSKYFGMTGWRLGWVIAPEWMIEPMERLAQNIFLAAPTPSQHAALAAFSDRTRAVLEDRRRQFEARRNHLYSALQDLDFDVGPLPDGAFYLYADAGRFTSDSLAFCRQLLDHCGVAVTPGADFGVHAAATHVRFAYTTDQARLDLGIERLRQFVSAGG